MFPRARRQPGRRATKGAMRAWAAGALLPLLTLFLTIVAGAQGAPVRELLTAARKGDVATLRRVLSTGVDVDATDATFLQTALIRAAMFGQVESAKVLLAARADVEQKASPDGMRALHWAARQGS